MNRERWRAVFFLVILLFFSLFLRIIFMQPEAIFIKLPGDYYQKAMIGNNGIYRLQEFSMNEVYTKLLSTFMLVFGNSEVAGVYLNIILQVLSIVCIYLAIGLVANVQVSVLVSIAIFLIPFYSDKIYEISSFNLWILIYTMGFFALSCICKGVSMFIFKKKSTEQEQTLPFELHEEQTGVITLDDIIGGIDSSVNKDEDKQEKIILEQKEEAEVLPAGMKEIVFDDEEKKKKAKLIENPLPVPKRKVHKEMDFTVALDNANDDYDIKDISGMDFFDIE